MREGKEEERVGWKRTAAGLKTQKIHKMTLTSHHVMAKKPIYHVVPYLKCPRAEGLNECMLGVRVWLLGRGDSQCNTSCCESMVSPHPRTGGRACALTLGTSDGPG